MIFHDFGVGDKNYEDNYICVGVIIKQNWIENSKLILVSDPKII